MARGHRTPARAASRPPSARDPLHRHGGPKRGVGSMSGDGLLDSSRSIPAYTGQPLPRVRLEHGHQSVEGPGPQRRRDGGAGRARARVWTRAGVRACVRAGRARQEAADGAPPHIVTNVKLLVVLRQGGKGEIGRDAARCGEIPRDVARCGACPSATKAEQCSRAATARARCASERERHGTRRLGKRWSSTWRAQESSGEEVAGSLAAQWPCWLRRADQKLAEATFHQLAARRPALPSS